MIESRRASSQSWDSSVYEPVVWPPQIHPYSGIISGVQTTDACPPWLSICLSRQVSWCISDHLWDRISTPFRTLLLSRDHSWVCILGRNMPIHSRSKPQFSSIHRGGAFQYLSHSQVPVCSICSSSSLPCRRMQSLKWLVLDHQCSIPWELPDQVRPRRYNELVRAPFSQWRGKDRFYRRRPTVRRGCPLGSSNTIPRARVVFQNSILCRLRIVRNTRAARRRCHL